MAKHVVLKKAYYPVDEAAEMLGLDLLGFLDLVLRHKYDLSTFITIDEDNSWMTGRYSVKYSDIKSAVAHGAEGIAVNYEHDAYALGPDEIPTGTIPTISMNTGVTMSSLEISQLQLAKLLRLPASEQKKAMNKKVDKRGSHFAAKEKEMLRIAKRLFQKNKTRYLKHSGSLNQKFLAVAVYTELEKSIRMCGHFSKKVIAQKLGQNRSFILPRKSKNKIS